MNESRYVSMSTVLHRVGSESRPIYGALGVRYWLGTPGESEIISGSALMWEPIRLEDKGAFEDQIRIALKQEVARRLEATTGLMIAPDMLSDLEWLVIWKAELDTMQRVRAFEQGMSRALKGRKPSDLTSKDLGRLARQVGIVTQSRKDVAE